MQGNIALIFFKSLVKVCSKQLNLNVKSQRFRGFIVDWIFIAFFIRLLLLCNKYVMQSSFNLLNTINIQ